VLSDVQVVGGGVGLPRSVRLVYINSLFITLSWDTPDDLPSKTITGYRITMTESLQTDFSLWKNVVIITNDFLCHPISLKYLPQDCEQIHIGLNTMLTEEREGPRQIITLKFDPADWGYKHAMYKLDGLSEKFIDLHDEFAECSAKARSAEQSNATDTSQSGDTGKHGFINLLSLNQVCI